LPDIQSRLGYTPDLQLTANQLQRLLQKIDDTT
jgi:hypothetical protein